MNSRISTVHKPLSYRLTSLCFVIGLSACTNTAALRDQERARYEIRESELISAQEADERRQRSEYRVTQKLQSLEAERAAQARIAQQTPGQSTSLSGNDTDSLSPISQTDVTPAVARQQKPLDDNAVWTLQNYPSPVDGAPLCAAVSTPVTVRNGTLDTKASIIVSADTVFLRTDATFDINALETGYRIDAGFPVVFDSFLNELTAVVDDNHTRLITMMQTGTTLSVRFAYSPQLSSASTHVIDLDLKSFAPVWSNVGQCTQ